jgi:hypothetical protein
MIYVLLSLHTTSPPVVVLKKKSIGTNCVTLLQVSFKI